MRKLWIFGIAFAFVGGLFLMEFYTSLRFPVTSYVPTGLPPLPVVAERNYDFFKDGEKVGSYIFRVEEIGEYEGQPAYFTRSLTSVVSDDTLIELETVYIFNGNLNPLEYRLNATLGEEHQSIACVFDGWNVDASTEMKGRRVEREMELPVDTVLIDTNMIGHWDLFFKSFDPEAGKRVEFTMFVPQVLDTASMELIVDKVTKTLTINEVDYECQIVRVSKLDITLYLYNDDVLKLEESNKNIEIVFSFEIVFSSG